METVIKKYLGLIIVIILWVAVWALWDDIARWYFKRHSDKMVVIGTTIAITSFLLINYFPEQLSL